MQETKEDTNQETTNNNIDSSFQIHVNIAKLYITLSFKITANDTISHIKQLIQDETGIPSEQIILFYKCINLSSSYKPACYYQICNGSKLQATFDYVSVNNQKFNQKLKIHHPK